MQGGQECSEKTGQAMRFSAAQHTQAWQQAGAESWGQGRRHAQHAERVGAHPAPVLDGPTPSLPCCPLAISPEWRHALPQQLRKD